MTMETIRKITALLLAALMVFSSGQRTIPVGALTALADEITAEEPSADSDGVYQIGTAAELYWFAGLVNGTLSDGSQNAGANAVLTADITVNTGDLSGYDGSSDNSWAVWTPIGGSDGSYTGTFDGQGYTISGLYSSNNRTNRKSLFGQVEGGTIKNVSVSNSYFYALNYAGGICGYSYNSSITNCSSSAYVGGIGYIGGICGYARQTTVTNSSFSGSVSGSNYNIGGICGYIHGSSVLRGCVNYGSVECSENYTGGICGNIGPSSTAENCGNYGRVTGGGSYTGGICGYLSGSSAAVKYCSNAGAVTGTSSAGGICGYISAGTVTGCYYLESTAEGGISGIDVKGSAEAKSESSYNSGSVAFLLNGSSSSDVSWYQNLDNGETIDSYPVPDSSHGTVYLVLTTIYCPGCTEISSCSNTDTEGSTVVAEGGSETEHTYKDNVCIYCGEIEILEPEQSADGYYEIADAARLAWLAEQVNSNAEESKSASDTNTEYNAVLTADIDLSGANWTPIGYTSAYNGSNNYKAYSYMGTFDGQGHVIKNMTVNTGTNGYAGLFGAAYNAEIKNLGVEDAAVGGIGDNIGGIIGRQDGGSLSECYFTGTVTGGSYAGALTGWANGTAKNCFTSAEVSGGDNVYPLFGTNADSMTAENCYYDTSKTDLTDNFGTGCSAEEFAVGRVAGSLNENSTSGGTVWYQNVDNGEAADPYPVFDSTHGIVYCYSNLYFCPNKCYESYYSNSADLTDNITSHTYENDICIYCGYDKNTPDTDENGVYQIGTADELLWFAKQVNSNADESKSAAAENTEYNAALTADIDLSGIEWTPIGYTSAYNGNNHYKAYSYTGTFDGQGHVIKNMTVNIGTDGYGGLFGAAYSAEIKNLGVEDAAVSGSGDNIGGIIGRQDGGSLIDCYFTGTVAGGSYAGALTGWSNGTGKNCHASAEVSGDDMVYPLFGTNASDMTAENCYYDTSKTDLTDSRGTGCSADEFAGGRVAVGLNENSTSGTVWHQNIDNGETADLYPVLDSSHGSVYCISDIYLCPDKYYESYYSNSDSVTENKTSHTYEDGICIYCGAAAAPEADADGVYQISSAGELYWFAGLVNGTLSDADQNTGAKAVLTADIVVNTGDISGYDGSSSNSWRVWTPIGNSDSKYTGTFDGQGHTISGLFNNGSVSNYNGLFGYISEAAVENVSVLNSYFYVSNDAGGICGFGYGSSITNCSSSAYIGGMGYIGGICGFANLTSITDSSFSGIVSGSNYDVGGICGYIQNSSVLSGCANYGSVKSTGNYTGGICGNIGFSSTAENCGNYGRVTGNGYTGGICGYLNSGEAAVKCCISTGRVTGTSSIGGICGYNASGSVTGCYYLEGTAGGGISGSDAEGSAEVKSESEFNSGTVAYILNGSISGGTIWYQNLDNGETADPYPVPDSSHGVVYASTVIYCPDCTEVSSCSNTEGTTVVADGCSATAHAYQNGICIYCGAIEVQEPTKADDGYYEIENALQLAWFAQKVNANAEESKTSTDENTEYNARLTADIDLSGADWTPIGYTALYNGKNYYKAYSYTGTFDGQGHVIKNMTVSTSANGYAGLFGAAYSAEIKNLGVENAEVAGSGENIGGIIGRQEGGSLTDCYFVGTVSGGSFAGSLTGWSNGTNTNCYASAEISGTKSPLYALFGTDDSTISTSNCYYDTSKTDLTDDYGTGCSGDDFTGGCVTYILNENSTSSTVWYQNIDSGETADSYPVLDSTHSIVYCLSSVYLCPGKYSDVYYTNIQDFTGNAESHTYEDGVCIYCGLIDITKTKPEADESGVYQISTVGELYWFAGLVNGTLADVSQNTGANAVLTADITVNTGDLSGYDGSSDNNWAVWTPIGGSESSYTGTFDGQGYTVNGLYINDSSASYVGLFGYASGGTIKNVSVLNSYFYAYQYVAGICGYIYNSSIINCSSSAYAGGSAAYIGGICGYASRYSAVTNCCFTGRVSGSDYYTGGICGLLQYYSSASSCANYGSVTNSSSYTGGICGGLQNYTAISGCTNYGPVNSSSVTGGIMGIASGGITAENCGNYGTVTCTNTVGGICGYFTSGTIKYCSNVSTVTGTTNVGGICGYNLSTITDCYYLEGTADGGIAGSDADGTAEAKSESEYNSGSVAWLLNGSSLDSVIWYQNLDNGETADSYPVLDSSHGIVYCEIIYSCPNNYSCGSTYSNTQIKSGSLSSHTYENGVCIYCGRNEDEPESDEKGVYQIGTADELLWFAEQVNANAEESKSSSDTNTEYNAVLTADIDLSGISWTPIGYTSACNGNNYYKAYSYTGTFDGNGHIIKNMTVNTDTNGYAGLFGGAYNAVIKNLGVEDASVSGSGENIGGIIGRQDGGSLTDCYFVGTVSGNRFVGGLAGWSNGTNTNCYASAEISGSRSPVFALFGTDDLSISASNCYYDMSKTSLTDSYGTGFDADTFAGGKVTWLLNGSSKDGIWVQTIGTDSLPAFAASVSGCAVVVEITEDGSTVYANTVSSGISLSISSAELLGVIIDTAVYGDEGGAYLDSVGLVVNGTLHKLTNFYYEDENEQYAFFPVSRDSNSSSGSVTVRGEATASSESKAGESLLYYVTEASDGLTIKEAQENSKTE